MDYLNTIPRIPFWFLLDLILSSRFTSVYNCLLTFVSRFTFTKSVRLLQWNENHLPFLVIAIWILCTLGISVHSIGVPLLYLFVLAMAVSYVGICSNMLMLNSAYNSLDHITSIKFIDFHVCSATLLGLIALLVLSISAYPHGIRYSHLLLTSTFALLIPFLSCLPVWALNSTRPTLYSLCLSASRNDSRSENYCSTPSWLGYAQILLDPTGRKGERLLSMNLPSHMMSLQCPAPSTLSCSSGFWCNARKRDLLASYAFYFQPLMTFLFFAMCLKFSGLWDRFRRSVKEEIELYNMIGLLDFIADHWERLHIIQTLTSFWFFKFLLVVVLGPAYWPVTQNAMDTLDKDLNISIINSFTTNTSDVLFTRVLQTRTLVAIFVLGTETWLAVFGTVAFFGGLAVNFVNLNVFLMDPSGSRRTDLELIDADAPRDIHPWNIVEDPEAALHQNDILALELFSGVGWSCAIVFLFVAFQYDLPSLPLSQRVYCSLYGLMVMLISCIHPIQTLLKSFLLRLSVSDERDWKSHVRLIGYGVLLIFASWCIVIYVPGLLAEYVVLSEGRSNSTADAANHTQTVSPRFDSSVDSLKVRQLRIVLCGCQLLLSLSVTLVEYGIYLYANLHPNWVEFRSTLFWTKIVTSVLDYMLSVFSFLTVCWLSIYDSIGLCRLFIIFCHFYYLLYPSAVRAYKWVRWRLSFQQLIDSLAHPTEVELLTFDNPCPICLDVLSLDTAKLTRCGHIYHTECLITWMRRQSFCPICHSDLFAEKSTTPSTQTTNDVGAPAH